MKLMKLKPTVAICALGLLGTAFAGTMTATGANTQQMGMKNRVAKLESVLDRNVGQSVSFSRLPNRSWDNRITVTGLMNVDAVYGDHSPNQTNMFDTATDYGTSYHDINLANANVFVDADLGCWTTAHVGINYWNSHASVTNIQPHASTDAAAMVVDEAFLTMSNFAKTPFYMKAGLGYVDFGVYHRFPIVAPMTQMLAQTREAALTVGFNHNSGVNGSIYVFNGMDKSTNNAGYRRINTGGVHVSYVGMMNRVNYNVSLDWTSNIANADFISRTVGTDYEKKVAGMSAHAQAMYQGFMGTIDYVAAAKKFDANDVSFGTATTAAKPRALDVDLAYAFRAGGFSSHVGITYEKSWESSGLDSTSNDGLPESRYGINGGIQLAKGTDLMATIYKNKDYSTTDGGTGESGTTGVIRLGMRFA